MSIANPTRAVETARDTSRKAHTMTTTKVEPGRLNPYVCGPHCGIKDKITGHCQCCHDRTCDAAKWVGRIPLFGQSS